MPEVISIVNQKGGTGKTTSTVNIGCGLAKSGYDVLLIDIDPQGNLSYSLAINEFEFSTLHFMLGEVSIAEAVVSRENVDVIPTDVNLSKIEMDDLTGEVSMTMLQKALVAADQYDFILIDCPPSFSRLTTNALLASHKVLVPMQLDVFSIEGLHQISNTVSYINNRYNHTLEILGVLPVMVDRRKKLTREVLDYVRQNFDLYLFENHVRTNVKAAEAPSFGISTIGYAPSSNSAIDYLAVTQELLKVLKKKNRHQLIN